MYLYQENDNNICVYELLPIMDKIRSFKQNELDLIPSQNKFYNSVLNLSTIISEHPYEINYNDIVRIKTNGAYLIRKISFIPREYTSNNEQSLYNYVNGPLKNDIYPLHIVNNLASDLEYMFVLNPNIETAHKNDILRVTRRLFSFELLMHDGIASLNYFNDEDIASLIDLFMISGPVYEMPIIDYQKLTKFGLINEDNCTTLNKQINGSKRILSLKKHGC